MPEKRAEPTEAEKNLMAASHPGLYKVGCVGLIAPALFVFLIITGSLLGGIALWIVAPLAGLVLIIWALRVAPGLARQVIFNVVSASFGRVSLVRAEACRESGFGASRANLTTEE